MLNAGSSRIALALACAVLVVLHIVQPGRGSTDLLFGFLPWDLTYHLLWMGAAAAVVLFTTDVVWRDE